MDFCRVPSVLGPSLRTASVSCEPGFRLDDWGSLWSALQNSVSGEVVRPVLGDWDDLDTFSPPWETIEENCHDEVDDFCRSTEQFMLGEVGPGPFERLQYLRGTEALFVDLAEQPRQLTALVEVVHEFYLRHIGLWCNTDVDGITMGDAWGSQTNLLISPNSWRSLFRPLYAEYFDTIHRAGKRVFFHSDGVIREIIPDLIDIGVDALNSQVFCMDIDELGKSFRNRITFWGEIDRQYLLPFGSPDDVRKAVRQVRSSLGGDGGGLIAQLAWGVDDPFENIVAAFEEWEAA